ncbi:unnamed protein product [Phytophthora lilii]|uniref:Unnamed protein product n=1 Tax=Phytophthora lilii TaxID=2077276 RepID=A0A9W6U796_9STRA|nr:unnamed protein product [Phytophthora lilii]
MKFCPKIKYLDGYAEVCAYGDAQCKEMWSISLQTWEAFNATCTNLRDFSWAVVPFADPFFQVFGQHVKPRLETLSLSANMSWDYARYFQECDGSIVWPNRNAGARNEGDPRPGYSLLASELSVVLIACPALTSLSIEVHQLQNGRSPYVNTDLYGDKLWESVAEHCPLLESITISDCSGYEVFDVKSIETLTDRTLVTFASMTSLLSVNMAPARLTGQGIFEYTSRVSKIGEPSKSKRTLELRVGGHQRSRFAVPSFYAVIVDLLKLLSEISEEALGAAFYQKPQIYIANPYKSRVDRSWCEPYMRNELKPLLEAVKEKHPSLGLGVHLLGLKENRFSRIDFITLNWRP